MIRFLSLMQILMISTAFAALPPLWEDVREIKAIFEDPQFAQNLSSGEMIQTIEKQEDKWLITTNKSLLTVKVIPESQHMPGLRNWTLQFFHTSH